MIQVQTSVFTGLIYTYGSQGPTRVRVHTKGLSTLVHRDTHLTYPLMSTTTRDVLVGLLLLLGEANALRLPSARRSSTISMAAPAVTSRVYAMAHCVCDQHA